MLSIKFHPGAHEEFREATLWYNLQKEGLGLELFEEVSKTLKLISEKPAIWPKYLDHFHRIILKRFPYNIVYRVQDDYIEVIAIAHQKRKPSYWKNRI
ncbi:MAG: type II toxin-antitoxin system RelE/ParE family toxin [Leptospirales bacterium]